MIITDKMIKELQRRIDVSYEEAERYLKRAGGNIDLAESYANKRRHTLFHRVITGLEKLVNASLIYHFKVMRKNAVLMDIPIFTIVILFFVIGDQDFLRLGVVFIIGALISECQMELHRKERKEPYQLYRTVKKTKAEPQEPEIVYYDVEEEENPPSDNIREEAPEPKTEGYQQAEAVHCDIPPQASSHDFDDEEEFYEVTIDK